jgi:hypothetical protein
MYNCTECANKGTPLCNECSSITKPSGEETRPTEFLHVIPLSEKEKTESNIRAYLERSKPIPITLVMKYNELHEEE